MTKEYDLRRAMAELLGRLDDLPPEPPFSVYVPEVIAKDAEAQGIDLEEFYWNHFQAKYSVDKPIPYEQK